MTVTGEQARALRLRRHHLDRPLPSGALVEAAAGCGVQNSPPGAWETALWNRVEDVTLPQLEQALNGEKTLLRPGASGVCPWSFPPRTPGSFSPPCAPGPGRSPGSTPGGITGGPGGPGARLRRPAALVESACACLDKETVQSKEALDRRLAGVIEPMLPPEVRPAWNAPIHVRTADRQTVGGAAVSFLLRPCSFRGKVVLGPGRGSTPPSPPPPGGWGDLCLMIQTARGSWCAGFSAVTAPPRSPTFRAGWAAPPSRPSGCGAALRTSWRR